MKRWATVAVLMVVSAALILLPGCQPSSTPNPQTQTAAPPPPPPPPPPETSQGTLVSVERSDKAMAKVMYLTTSGLRSEIREQKAGQGTTFLVLHFTKKPGQKPIAKQSGLVELSSSGSTGRLESTGGKNMGMWLTDAAGKKYNEGIGVSGKDKAHMAYRIPTTATGLVWHDGDQAYELEPKIAPVKATPK